MNNTLLNGEVLYYALKVDGKVITPAVADRFQLEQFRFNLPVEKQRIAEVVCVTQQGQELLLG